MTRDADELVARTCKSDKKKFDWIFVVSTFSRRQFDTEGRIDLEL